MSTEEETFEDVPDESEEAEEVEKAEEEAFEDTVEEEVEADVEEEVAENPQDPVPTIEEPAESEQAESESDAAPSEVTDNEEEEQSVEDPRQCMRDRLSNGFKGLKEKMNGSRTANNKASRRQPHSHVAVNFIDPTTASSASTLESPTSGQKFSFMSPLGGKGTAGDPSVGTLNLYEKLTSIFETDYSTTLHSVPYEHARTGAPGNIERLPLRTVLTQSHGTSHASSGDAGVPWAGTSGSAAAPVSDPAEWHTGPFCHVYVAACESIDHYRQKVRPSLQAFVSQIEGSSNRNAGTKARNAANNYSSQYVIIYVPIRNSKPESAPNSGDGLLGGNRLGGAIASRMAAARRQMQTAATREMSSDSQHSTGSALTSTDFDTSDEASAAPPPGPVTHSSRTEKEIFKKFCHDFPNGRTCILSTLMDSIDGAVTTSPLKNQEWSSFLRMLGSAVVGGFRDRCKRYDEELRRLDAARANSNNTRSLSSKLGKNANTTKFDLGHFFLVKESLAFTFEQMQIPSEALLQYEELRAFLPETSGDEESIVETDEEKEKRRKKAAKSQVEHFDETATALAIIGDTSGFRKRLRAVTDLGIVEQTVLHYMYARETSLLFQLGAPVEILDRSHSFVQNMYRMKGKGIGVIVEKEVSDEELAQRKHEAELWALQFCWDVKCATDNFFTVLQINDDQAVTEYSFSKLNESAFRGDDDGNDRQVDPAVEDVEMRMASKVGELLEFARLRYLRLGDEQESFENPIRKIAFGLPADMMKPWEPWVAEGETPHNAPGASEQESPVRRILKARGDADLLDGVFTSAIAYENRYLQLAGAVARCNRLAGRRRLASRFQTEIAEIYMSRQDYQSAVKALLPIVEVCANDAWDRCHFWHLFRLASCQRTRGKIPAYLNTLTLCFGPHLKEVAPVAAAAALQKDFEAVVSHPQVATLRLGISSFLETDVVIEPTSGGRSSMLLNFVRKKMTKCFCKVGEVVHVKLTVRSHLCQPISADAINILLVGFEKYEELFHNRELVSTDDAFANMKLLDSDSTIKPGDNEYRFSWTPMSTGIFTLATVQLQWKHGCFHYDSAILRKPLSALEVLPSDPTQTIELNPLFLIPGQEQQVRITFNAGSDIIREGTVELVCSDGLKVLPPGTDPGANKWVETCSVDLPPCGEDGTVVLKTSVKSRLIKSIEQRLGLTMDESPGVTSGTVQTMQARVMTSYYHKGYEEATVKQDEGTPCMRTTLEAMVTTLDKPAFTVDECRSYSYSEDRTLITVVLHCNTPVPFSIKEWKVELPMLQVLDDGDMNQELFTHAISEGEQLSLAFNCSHKKDEEPEEAEPVLHLVLQDEFGKTFNQVLSLDLVYLYDQMRKDEEYSVANRVEAEMTCSASEGLVGSPVTFSVKVDASGVAKPKRSDGDDSIQLLYKVHSDETDWIIGGKVKGLLDCSRSKTFQLEFVGIPAHPGIVKEFPTLSVQYKSREEDAPPMTVHLRHQENFKSLSFVNHMALACPVGIES